eukprot:m.162947 g.162947  ORF g.162947 m.162947 type:complete len:120 (+) comp18090_c0_seq2:117-476(+)
MADSRTLEAIKYRNDYGPTLQIINQRKLPHETVFEPILGTADGWKAINEMRVRGAPAIAIVGVLSLVIEMHSKTFTTAQEVAAFVEEQLLYVHVCFASRYHYTRLYWGYRCWLSHGCCA